MIRPALLTGQHKAKTPMDELRSYIPIDRLHAIASGHSLPDRAHGTALFADISGFTPLTEAFVRDLGPQRGAEEIVRHINAVFDRLIAAVDMYHGSVIIFGGDAITCWFDGDDGLRAAASALAMQAAMQQFSSITTRSGNTISIALKVALATGPVRRFVVGDPQLQLIDVLAGSTLDRLAECEHHAARGEIVLSPETVDALAGRAAICGWHVDETSGIRYGILDDLNVAVSAEPWLPLVSASLHDEEMRPWLLPAVYERLRSGQGEFLAEVRPAVPMFLYFSGIDYDSDNLAGEKLDRFIRQVEKILAVYEGNLLSIVIGDKGSYLHATFGVPLAHEDDALRAARAALELRALAQSFDGINDIRIGISQGWLFSGASGSATRRTYVTNGDEVNLAARLMQAAGPGQILVTSRIEESIALVSSGENLPPIKVKGKSGLIPIFSLQALRARDSIHMQQPRYAFPMVGRASELEVIRQKIDTVSLGKGQVIGLMGDAGLGKSRLVAEVIRMAHERELAVYGGECQAYGTHTNYLVWRSVWNGLFDLDPHASLDTHTFNLSRQLVQIDPVLLSRLPLLGAVVNLPLPDNDLTRGLDAKTRKNSLEALLVDVLRHKVHQGPIIFILEDCQWIDDLSQDLLGVIGRAITNLPVLMLVTFRPLPQERWQQLHITQMPHYTELPLAMFSQRESAELIRLRLGHLTGVHSEVPPELVERVTARTDGNPFYIEELLNYLQDRGLDPFEPSVLEKIDLPDSLYSLILSRIDQIGESQKVTLKVASVIGRVFKAAWVWGYYPQLGEPGEILASLNLLNQADITPWVPEEPEQTYLFKHMLTQEVAYDSLSYTTRTRLHGMFGCYIEQTYHDRLERFIDLLAFHFDHSDLPDKRREYLRKAGEYSQQNYANAAAVDYYRRLLPLAPDEEKIQVHLKLGQVLELIGRWNDAGESYHQAFALAERNRLQKSIGQAQTAVGELYRKQGRLHDAAEWLEKARQVFEALGDAQGTGQVLHYYGTLSAVQGNYALATDLYEKSLAIRQEAGDHPNIASLLSNMGIVARMQGNLTLARALHEQALSIRRSLGDRWAIGVSLVNLGNVAIDQGNFSEARALQEEGLAMRREVGDPWAIANALNNLGNLAREQGDYSAACSLYHESLRINHELDGKWAIAYLLEDIGYMAALCGMGQRAFHLVGAASSLRKTLGAPLSPAEQKKQHSYLEPARQSIGESGWTQAAAQGETMTLDQAVAFALETRATF